jgi:hypothetical protein
MSKNKNLLMQPLPGAPVGLNVNSTDLSEEIVEKQEHLSVERIKNLEPKLQFSSFVSRPQANLIDLMHWVKNIFSDGDGLLNYFNSNNTTPNSLKNYNNLQCFIHNKIVIDGAFMQFCEENDVKVTCLMRDSVASWKTEHDSEHFMMQGIFQISTDKFDFLHCALFHKGNQNEDEVSFFVVASEDIFEQYLELRNKFDKWLVKRDRDHLEIHVVGGEGMSYDRKATWNDLFLEPDLKEDIKNYVEGFLNSKHIYEKMNVNWKTGALLYGVPGCHSAGTKVLMFDGTLKKVEDVKVGDFLLGPDSNKREVLKLVSGKEEMYEISPIKGDSFIVNKNHMLHLTASGKNKGFPGVFDLTVDNLLKTSVCFQQRMKLTHSKCVEFGNTKEELPIDPYFLGLWLGDGTASKPQITTADQEIKNVCLLEAEKRGLNITIYKKRKDGICETIDIVSSAGTKKSNSLINDLRKINVWKNKNIPDIYLRASVKDRLELLAGIIDTDGSYSGISWNETEKFSKKGYKGVFDFIQKDEKIARDVRFLAKSLGFGVQFKKCTKTIKSIGFTGEYFRLCIYGEIHRVPTRLPRKMALVGKANKDELRVGIKEIKLLGVDNYYGFTLSDDHLYMTDDFVIHHNCGKSSIIRTLIAQYNFKPVTVQSGAQTNDDTITEAFAYAASQEPALLYIEDLDTMLDKTISLSHFLNQMDGVTPKNGLMVIATANDLSKLKESVVDRPSRFDRKFEFPLPDFEMSKLYLKKWFDGIITDAEINKIAKQTTELNFSFAYLKELYIGSVYTALADKREIPTLKDVNITKKRMIKDKENVKNNFELSTNSGGIGFD